MNTPWYLFVTLFVASPDRVFRIKISGNSSEANQLVLLAENLKKIASA